MEVQILNGKTVVVTGANSGIGLETTKALAKAGARVVMACRDAQRAADALAEARAESGSELIETMALDLASQDSIRQFALLFQQRFIQLDVLVNNAGVLPLAKQMTGDGFEMQIGVNHLGHFLLTHLLLPELIAAKSARVINVASMFHHIGKIDFGSFRGEKRYGPFKAYGQSKLANVLFTRELARRYGEQGITSFSVHPGMVATSIAGRSPFRRGLYKLLGGPTTLTAARGAQSSIYLATEANIEKYSGSYFDEFQKIKPGSKLSQNVDLARELWLESEAMLSIAADAGKP